MSAAVLVGDVRRRLREVPEGTVQCVVTSPPYFGLRDYGVGGQIGLEQTPDCLGWATKAPCGTCYVCRMVEVFREVRRVLREDGVVFLNLGDSYAAKHVDVGNSKEMKVADMGLKAKDLIGIPWRVALALQANGWYLRQDIIWAKGNPMPESVKDRCTKSHEHVFLLAKSERYWWDGEAAKEPSVQSPKMFGRGGPKNTRGVQGYADASGAGGQAQRDNSGGYGTDGLRNRRDVWNINTKPYKGAHFAVMPEALADLCVRLGSRPGDTVLDPFAGSGTTAACAVAAGRSFIGCELNVAYTPLMAERVAKAGGALTVDEGVAFFFIERKGDLSYTACSKCQPPLKGGESLTLLTPTDIADFVAENPHDGCTLCGREFAPTTFSSDPFYRADGRVELLCSHGVGHPSRRLQRRPWDEVDGIHGCDGCCGDLAFAAAEREAAERPRPKALSEADLVLHLTKEWSDD